MLRYVYTASLLAKTRGGGLFTARYELNIQTQVRFVLVTVGRAVGTPLLIAETGRFDPRSVHIKVCGGQSCTGTYFL